ncbi:uncharacterized protein LOC135125926 [Zophobas morio]|uniref:uncharacterized protein LOC135125926 n=1 Tax=Zophobas morio TaxID=2755281 RepID=UPI0030832212
MALECTECNRTFTIKSNLTRHLRMVHSIEVERLDILPRDIDTYHYKCLEGCNISFKYNRELRKHLRLKHEVNLVELNLEFPNTEVFNKWLHDEETNNCVQYVHLTATKRKTTGTETYYYECSRTGRRTFVDDTIRKRKSRKWPTKLNRGCTSQIIVNKSHDGSLSIIYFKTHYGHDIGIEHMKLSKQDRGAIASKLLLGLPITTVLHSAKNTAGDIKRINLIERKDIVNIRRAFNIDLKDGKVVNMNPINAFLAECSNHKLNPILYCNVDSFPECEDICVIIMTKYQSEMLKAFGGNIVVINSVPLKNCDFELITIFVIGKSWKNEWENFSSWESYPAACMFTNNVSSSYSLFFTKIKEKMGAISPKILFTNCDKMYYNTWKEVMGDVSHHLYTPIQIHIDWKLNLNRVICTEPDVTRIKRKWLFDSLTSVQNCQDESDFLENFEPTVKVIQNDPDFIDFHQYFVRHYNDPQKWATCYKTGLDLPLKQLDVISDVLRHYLNEETEIRFDKIFHSLIRFIRDETVNSMLNTKTNRVFFTNENDARHRALGDKTLDGTHLGENLWNVVEDQQTHLVQKFLEKRCCNLVCSTCHICLHCFSCSCVDFFVENAICVHIHYIWVTYFQSIVQNEDDLDEEIDHDCTEEIIIEVDEKQEYDEMNHDVHYLRNAIVEKSSILCESIGRLEDKSALKAILDTINQLCDFSVNGEVSTVSKSSLGDHSYL